MYDSGYYNSLTKRLSDYKEQVSLLESVSIEDDMEDPVLLLAYYQLQAMRRAHPVMHILEDSIRLRRIKDPIDEAMDLIVPYNQIVDVVEEFDQALTDFTSKPPREDDEDYIDLEEDEDDAAAIMSDKIKNLRSSFRYYWEEIGRVYGGVKQ